MRKVFDKLMEQVTRKGKDKLIEWLEKTDYFTAPASAYYHSFFPWRFIRT